jgi:hypothetical protein
MRLFSTILPSRRLQSAQAKKFAAEDTTEPDTKIQESLDQMRATASESVLLMHCVQNIEQSTSLKEVVEVAVQYLRRTTPATVYALYQHDPQADDLVCANTSGDARGLLNGLVIPVGQRVSGWAAANERTAINSDASLDLARIANFSSLH